MKTLERIKYSRVFLTIYLVLFLSICDWGHAAILEEGSQQSQGAIVVAQEMREEKGKQTPEYVPGEVLVKFKEGGDPSCILNEAGIEAKNIEKIHTIAPVAARFKKDYKLEKDSNGWYSFLGKNYKEIDEISDEEIFKEAYQKMPDTEKTLYRAYRLKLPEEISVEDAVARLGSNPNVEYAEPNYVAKIQTPVSPNDRNYLCQWAHQNIHSPEAWGITTGAPAIIIAIIDTGIYYAHPDLAANMWNDGAGHCGYDFINHNADPKDDNGHGTHCAGIAAAVGNNKIGIAGMSWNCKLMAVKGLNAGGSGDFATLAACITYAADNHANILSNSWGPEDRLPSCKTVEDAIDDAYAKGCVIVFAAGNSYDDATYYSPANYPKVIAVAATDRYNAKASFSNCGPVVDVASPGVDILSTVPPSGQYGDPSLYKSMNGTSMACPYVAGLAALVLSSHQDYTKEQVGWLIKETAQIIPGLQNNFYPGFGLIDAAAALQYPSEPPLLTAEISKIEIDYASQHVHIRGAAGGRDFQDYYLEYLTGPGTWAQFYYSSIPVTDGSELCDWHLTCAVPEKAILRLTVRANDLIRKTTTCASLGLGRHIEPQNMTNVQYITKDDKLPQGISRMGDSVSFTGTRFGDYSIEWRKSGSSDWHSDGMDYSDLEPGYLGRWDTSVVSEAGVYEVRLSDVFGSEKHAEIVLDNSIMSGWPVAMTHLNVLGQPDSSSIHSKIGNLDDDPLLEVVSVRTFDHSARVYIHDDNGMLKEGWPKILDGETGYSYHPSLMDMDGDGKDEIFISTGKRQGSGFLNTLYCLKGNKDIVFQKPIAGSDLRGDICRDPVMVCDLDKNGIKEIVYRHSDAVYMLDPSGNDLPGWPKYMQTSWILLSVDGSPNLMAVGNFYDDPDSEDDDSDLELVVVQNEGWQENIHIFNLDGTDVPGWPQSISGYVSIDWIVCGDMNGDGLDELAVTGTSSSFDKTFRLFGNDGNLLFTKYLPGMGSSTLFCMMADINNDNKAELIFTNSAEKKVYAVDVSGANIPGWPCPVPNAFALAARLVCDIDGDEQPEVVGYYTVKKPGESAYQSKMFVIRSNGVLDTANQFNDKYIPSWVSSINFCDIDRDGCGELVMDANLLLWLDETLNTLAYWKPSIYVFKTNSLYRSAPSYWQKYFGDNSNTARYVIRGVNNPPQIPIMLPQEATEKVPFSLIVSAADPDGDHLNFPQPPDLPVAAVFTDNGDGTALFSWTPECDQQGPHIVTFTALDGDLSASQSVTITVTNVNQVPSVNVPSEIKLQINKDWSYRIQATDPDGDRIKFEKISWPAALNGRNIPGGGLKLSDGGLLTLLPVESQIGTYTLSLKVSDSLDHPSDAKTTDFTITISIVNENQPPYMTWLGIWCGSDKDFGWKGYDTEDQKARKALTYQYAVDGGDWTTTKATMIKIMKVASAAGLGNGTHKFSIRAFDSAGLISEVRTIDFTLPLNSRPTISKFINGNGSASRPYSWSGKDPEDGANLKFEYNIGQDTWFDVGTRTTMTIAELKSTHSLKSRKRYYFTVRAKDSGGLTSFYNPYADFYAP